VYVLSNSRPVGCIIYPLRESRRGGGGGSRVWTVWNDDSVVVVAVAESYHKSDSKMKWKRSIGGGVQVH
jgi:hypothetical protein